MKGGCFGLLLLTMLFPVAAMADTPGTCSNKAADCTQTCNPPPGHDCVVLLQRSGTSVTMTVNGSATTIFCVATGTPVQWIVADASTLSFVDIRFSANDYPFPQSSLQGDSINSVAATISGAGCYQFALADCPASSSNSSCGYVDPKVVIMPPGLHHKGKVHHKPPPKTDP